MPDDSTLDHPPQPHHDVNVSIDQSRPLENDPLERQSIIGQILTTFKQSPLPTTAKEWEEEARKLKPLWDPQGEKKSNGFYSYLRYIEKDSLLPEDRETLEQLKKAVRRIFRNRTNKRLVVNSLENQHVIDQILTTLKQTPLPTTIKEWEQQARNLKPLWDPQEEGKIGGFYTYLRRNIEKDSLLPEDKKILQQLQHAAHRLYNRKQRVISPPCAKRQKRK